MGTRVYIGDFDGVLEKLLDMEVQVSQAAYETNEAYTAINQKINDLTFQTKQILRYKTKERIDKASVIGNKELRDEIKQIKDGYKEVIESMRATPGYAEKYEQELREFSALGDSLQDLYNHVLEVYAKQKKEVSDRVRRVIEENEELKKQIGDNLEDVVGKATKDLIDNNSNKYVEYIKKAAGIVTPTKENGRQRKTSKTSAEITRKKSK